MTTARSRTRRRAPRWTISASIPRGTPRTTLWDGPDTIHRRTTGTSASSSTIRRAGARVTTTSRSSARGSTIRSTCTAPTPTSSGTARRCPSANVATRTWGCRRAQASALTSPTSGTVSTSAARSELRCTNGARSRVSCRRRRRHRHRHRPGAGAGVGPGWRHLRRSSPGAGSGLGWRHLRRVRRLLVLLRRRLDRFCRERQRLRRKRRGLRCHLGSMLEPWSRPGMPV